MERPNLDFNKIKTFDLSERPCKVQRPDYAQRARAGKTFTEFWQDLPKQLQAPKLQQLVLEWKRARDNDKPVILLCGAHVLKVGLGPLIIQGFEQGWITSLSLNGAGAVHDFELAFQGATSEDVALGLEDGTFGMVRQTGEHLNTAACLAQRMNIGFGQALARTLEESNKAQYKEESVIYQGWRNDCPVTVHVAIGTDIVHQQPSADGAAIGAASYKDFQLLCREVACLQGGGLVVNIGSAVILPEVFLKALTVARNLTDGVEGFSAANFDMILQYRPRVNVVQRPTQSGGTGYQFVGAHEIMIPLLFQALAEVFAQ